MGGCNGLADDGVELTGSCGLDVVAVGTLGNPYRQLRKRSRQRIGGIEDARVGVDLGQTAIAVISEAGARAATAGVVSIDVEWSCKALRAPIAPPLVDAAGQLRRDRIEIATGVLIHHVGANHFHAGRQIVGDVAGHARGGTVGNRGELDDVAEDVAGHEAGRLPAADAGLQQGYGLRGEELRGLHLSHTVRPDRGDQRAGERDKCKWSHSQKFKQSIWK